MAVRTWVVGVAVLTQAFACGESSTSDDDPADESGGTAGQSSGGATGGSLATGGSVATGGSISTGGSVATGGSISTGGSVATGGSISTGGSGGASAGSPSGGSGGKSSNYGNPLPVDPRCEEFALRTASACPGDWSFETAHLVCQDFLNELHSIGCSGFDEFVTCEGEIDCAHGYARSCAEAFRECRNGFVEDTACVREGAGITCPEGSYAFICRLETPATCTPTETVGSATRACCPPFGTDSRG